MASCPFCRTARRPGWLGLAGWRYDLLSHVSGRVLEIGTRSGANYPYYRADAKVVISDVDATNMGEAIEKFARFPAGMEITLADAQHLPFADDTFDAVVATLVFCSIPDPGKALREISRVLTPNGKLYSIEHMRSRYEPIGLIQDVFHPAWHAVTGGCHLNRHTESIIRAAEFEIVERRTSLGGIFRWLISQPAEKQESSVAFKVLKHHSDPPFPTKTEADPPT